MLDVDTVIAPVAAPEEPGSPSSGLPAADDELGTSPEDAPKSRELELGVDAGVELGTARLADEAPNKLAAAG